MILSPVRLPVPPLQLVFGSFEFTVPLRQPQCSGSAAFWRIFRGANGFRVAIPADKEAVDLSAIAVQGLERSQDRFDRASSHIAAAGLPPVDSTGDTVNLSQATVALLSAKDDFAANLKVMKTADEMQRVAINLLA
jgi:hypothetical protein